MIVVQETAADNDHGTGVQEDCRHSSTGAERGDAARPEVKREI